MNVPSGRNRCLRVVGNHRRDITGAKDKAFLKWKEETKAAKSHTIKALSRDDNAEDGDWSDSDVEDEDNDEKQIFSFVAAGTPW